MYLVLIYKVIVLVIVVPLSFAWILQPEYRYLRYFFKIGDLPVVEFNLFTIIQGIFLTCHFKQSAIFTPDVSGVCRYSIRQLKMSYFYLSTIFRYVF